MDRRKLKIPARAEELVAQAFSLPYRRLAVGMASQTAFHIIHPANISCLIRANPA
jgi:hypothetical protein